jgi:D-serine deaminase-like pyridoxal phosphate-dependent protein
VLSTVCSRPRPGRWGAARAVCDAGTKAIDLGSGLPTLHGAIYRSGGDEHGILELNSRDGLGFAVGDVVQLR